MPIAADLFALQEVDTAITACTQELDALNARLDEEQSDETRVQVAEQEVRRAAAEHAAREVETDIADLRAKIAPVDEKLYDGSVRSPKELQSLQDELEMHNRHLRQLEDRQLQAMEELEASGAALVAARDRLQQQESTRTVEVAAMNQRRAVVEAELDRLQQQRQTRAQRIDPPRLALYERLRTTKRGRAVAKIERGVCLGCRITLPTTIQQRARSAMQVVQCTSCERILFAG